MMMGKTKPVTTGLKLDNVSVAYRNGHTALKHASFEVPKGTITALVGVNGAGKSTLFKAIMGFVLPIIIAVRGPWLWFPWLPSVGRDRSARGRQPR